MMQIKEKYLEKIFTLANDWLVYLFIMHVSINNIYINIHTCISIYSLYKHTW
jgi:hypothetical protein